MHPFEIFEVLARATWRTIDGAYSNRIRFGEDAITSINLNAIASKGPNCVVVEDTRIAEHKKGCDFELWIGCDSLGWSRYAIQAKKINPAKSTYDKLDHSVGSRKQIDILENYASANRAAGLYCFYNFVSSTSTWNCNLPLEIEQLGCSVTPLAVVRDAIARRGRRRFLWIHSQPETLPWRCLVKCPNLIARGSGSIASAGRWPKREKHFHKKLPLALLKLRETRSMTALLDAENLFNRNLQLFPRWVGVIDVSDSVSVAQMQ